MAKLFVVVRGFDQLAARRVEITSEHRIKRCRRVETRDAAGSIELMADVVEPGDFAVE